MSQAPKNINLAIIGCGQAGKNHASAARDCGFNIAVCVDPLRARAVTLAKQFSARSLDNPKEVFRDSSVDAVLVSTPTITHHRQVIDALKAGKAVFCETPLANTTARCREIERYVARAETKLFVAQPFQYSRPWTAIKSQLASGAIGTPGSVRTFRGWPMPKGANRGYREASGGPIFDVLIHDFGWICATFGPPSAVFCQTTPPSETKPGVHVMASLVLKSGLIAQCIGSWAYSRPQCRIELCGTEGIIQFNSLETPTLPSVTDADPGDHTLCGLSDLDQWRAFKKWIEDDYAPTPGALDASQALSIAEAAAKSALTRRRIVLADIHDKSIA